MDKENYKVEQLKTALAKARKTEKSICVTGFIQGFHPTTDVSFEKAQQRKHPLPESVDKINQGIKTHKFAMARLNNIPQEPSNDYDKTFIKWWQDRNGIYTIVGAKVKIYSKMYPLSGEIDAVLYDRTTGNFTVVEFKTAADMFTDRGTLIPPFNDYRFTNCNIAKLQVAFYCAMLREYTTNPVNGIVLWLKKNGYEEFPVSKQIDKASVEQLKK